MLTFDSAYLRTMAVRVFRAAGAAEPVAVTVADALVDASLVGHDSHGIIRIVEYVQQIRSGTVDPAAQPEIVKETSTTLLVDGHWGFGQVTARWTMGKVIAKAKVHHIACAGIHRCGHIGLAGSYPAMAAQEGLIGLAFVNGGGSEPRVAPFGGSRPVFGTNPLAAAIPTKDSSPILLDFSTAAVASGKIRIIRDKGELLPDGWILDREGSPSRLPEDYYQGGMLLTAAGHKGYGLSILVEVLGGLLTSAGSLILPDSGYKVGNGVFLLALNVEAFRPLDVFLDQVAELSAAVKAVPPLGEGEAVMLPGEIEQTTRKCRLAEGIPVSEGTWAKISNAARELGVEI